MRDARKPATGDLYTHTRMSGSRRAALLLLLSIVVACGDDAGTTIDTGAATGEDVYVLACIECHAEDGAGMEGLGEPLAQSDFIRSRTDQELLDFIITGRSANDPASTSGVAMAPRAGRPNLSDTEILAVIAYLRTLQG
jgi:mono/diheme cytochrome c family protein